MECKVPYAMTGPGSPPYLVAPGSPPRIKHHECNLRGGPWPFTEQNLGGEGKRKSIQCTRGSKKETHFLDYHAGTFGGYTALKFLIHEQRLMYG